MKLLRHISFVDCPGHDVLMATMLNGAAVMDSALLLIAGNEPCPQPQTSEHLAAMEIMQLRNILILQNKIDLLKQQSQASSNYDQIKKFVEGTVAEDAPVIPISAQQEMMYNIDAVLEYIVRRIPVPTRNFTVPPRMTIIRSFDINKPGSSIDDLKGGVAGGTISQGILKVGDEIVVRPGKIYKDKNSRYRCEPIKTRVVSLLAESNELQFAVPGGLIGVGTLIDPILCKGDVLVGHVLTREGDKLPSVFLELDINFFLLRKLLGVQSTDKTKTRIGTLERDEALLLGIGSNSVGCKVASVKKDIARVILVSPACAEVGDKIAISRRFARDWRLIGWAKILHGVQLD